MGLFVHLALLGIIPLVLIYFLVLSPRRAVLASYLTAWLLLPQAGYYFVGLPEYDKVVATTVPVMLGIACFDPERFRSLRLHWFDLPMVVWCLYAIPSSVVSGLGIYDGLSGFLVRIFAFGLPYLVGRLYFSDDKGLRELAVALVVGGLIYVPLCLYEIRMSPQLNRMVYGFSQHQFVQHIRDGGYRPMVFMQHGLAVGLWMAVATLTAVVLWWSGARKRLWTIPIGLLAVALLVTTFLVKSIGALMLLMIGLGAYGLIRQRGVNPRYVLLALALASPLYLVGRVGLNWSGETLVAVLEPVVPRERLKSLDTRLDAENELRGRAWQRPLFGWGRTDRFRAADEEGQKLGKAIDSMWIITAGENGIFGLVVYMTMMTLPLVLIAWKLPPELLRSVAVAPIVALALALNIYLIDKMANAMLNPILLIPLSGLSAFACRHQFRKVVLPDARRAYVIAPKQPRRSVQRPPVGVAGMAAQASRP